MAPRRDAVVEILRQRFLSASHLGLLAPGDKLPSARDLARELGVDRRVVLAAYRFLEREGVIELRQRSGIYFAPAAAGAAVAGGRPGGAHAERAAERRRVEWMTDLVADAVAHGTPVPALADVLHQHVSTLRLRAACIECNDDQIAALCATLRDDYGLEATGVAIDPLRDVTASFPALFDDASGDPRGDADGAAGGAARRGCAPPDLARVPAELRRADVLVTTPFHAGDVQLVAARLGKPWIAAGLRADVFAELARLLEHGPAYAVVADPRFARKLALIYQAYRSAAGAPRFRALVAGRDDLAQLPAGAPTLVTRLARERLAGAPLAVHAIPEPRALSAGSARDVAAFIVRANAAALAARAAAC